MGRPGVKTLLHQHKCLPTAWLAPARSQVTIDIHEKKYHSL